MTTQSSSKAPFVVVAALTSALVFNPMDKEAEAAVINFDALEVSDGTLTLGELPYSEDGFTFTGLVDTSTFIVTQENFSQYVGSTTMLLFSGDTVVLTEDNNSLFGVGSVALSPDDFSSALPEFSVDFYGLDEAGNTLTQSCTV